MSVWTGIAVYFVIWWTVIFAVLPFGVRSVGAEDVAKGHANGAPLRPRIGLKLVMTTVVATIAWFGFYLIYESGWISFRQ